MISVPVIKEIVNHYDVTFLNKVGSVIHTDNSQIVTVKVFNLKGEKRLVNPVVVKVNPMEDLTFDLFINALAVQEAFNTYGALVNKIKTEIEKVFRTKSVVVEPKSYGVSLKFPRLIDKRADFIFNLLETDGYIFTKQISAAKKVCRFKIPKNNNNLNILESLDNPTVTIIIK